MHKIIVVSAIALLLAGSAQAMKPPREESPAPRETLEAFGAGNSDEELANAIAAADAHPLGSIDNPIRVAGPDGARAYLARLRCTDGSMPRIGAKSDGGVDVFGSVTELYPVTCGTAPSAGLVVDIYHEEHVETRPPAGFQIAH